jgi:hypothetical protein
MKAYFGNRSGLLAKWSLNKGFVFSFGNRHSVIVTMLHVA